MKRKLLVLTTLLLSYIATAQQTYVPDDAFESRLIQLGLDSGPLDNFVLTANISSLENLDVSNSILTDITGLQDFISLKDVRVSGPVSDLSSIENLSNIEELVLNDVTATTLDLSAFVNLDFVYITDTGLTSLDFSNNPNLVDLTIENTPLEDINLSNNPVLDDIYFSDTHLSQIDLSSCVALTRFLANYNPFLININISQSTLLEVITFEDNTILPYIDLSANTALTAVYARNNNALETIFIKSGNNTNIGQTFRVRNNPSLSCVEVDDVAWSNTFWGFATNYFSGFSANCAPTNDDCVQATPITLAQPASGTTQSATNSTNTPDCQENGIVIFDIWYEFIAPQSGDVFITIDASPLTAKVAFYESCSDPQPLFCEEGELSVENLTPGAPYYLQVWLESNTMNRTSSSSPENENGGFILNVQDASTLSVDEIQDNESQIRLYPNPAKEAFTVSAQTPIDTIFVYDMSGKIILKKENNNTHTETLPLENIASGMYIVQIKTAQTTVLKKLIIN